MAVAQPLAILPAVAERPAAAPAAERAPEPLVAFRGVRKSYDGHTLVVKDLDLEVERGEFLTLLGPSGSGKTTTLMMLAGFELPTAGEIFLEGAPVQRLPPEKRNIGMVFQNYALFPHMSVAQNIAFPLRYRGIRGAAAAARVARALAMVHLEDFGERVPRQLSGGQQQRVALARALVFEPHLVLMDEPLGALDKQLREHMQFEIKELQRKLGITIVYVTHDQSEALTMSDRIAVFHDGRIQQLAGPAEMYNAPANNFVAGFIGENNLLPCRVVTTDGSGGALVAMRNGASLAARTRHALRPGQEATVGARPEGIRLAAADGAPVLAELQAIAFLGDHVRAEVRAFGDASLTLKLPPGTALPPPGAAVGLHLDPAQCHVLVE